MILTSLTQNLLLQVGQGHWDPSQFSGLAWSCREANLKKKFNLKTFSQQLLTISPCSPCTTWACSSSWHRRPPRLQWRTGSSWPGWCWPAPPCTRCSPPAPLWPRPSGSLRLSPGTPDIMSWLLESIMCESHTDWMLTSTNLSDTVLNIWKFSTFSIDPEILSWKFWYSNAFTLTLKSATSGLRFLTKMWRNWAPPMWPSVEILWPMRGD